MPLGCRIIEPTCLGAHQVQQEADSDKRWVLPTVANNAIVGALLQLSSLVRHADDLFCDISDECQKVVERTDGLCRRIRKIDDVVSKLDAKQVTVPEGDLKQFTAIREHHEARHGYDSHIFLSTNRPQCVQDQYSLCQPNPSRAIRAADLYRKDGLSGSKMFKCWPVIYNDQKIRTPDLNLPRRIPRVHSFEKKYKQLKIRERPKTIHGWDDFTLDDCKNELLEESNKKDECLAKTEPPVMVSIDTSGSNFERMQSLRLSGRRYQTKEEREKKKKRRRTVSGVPDNIMHEIEKFDRKKKGSEGARQTPRSYSFDDLDADDDDVERDEGIMKYLDEIDGKMEERIGEVKAQKIMKYFPCRRSKSLPRCIKLGAVSRSLSADRKSQRDLNTTYGSSSLSLASVASSATSRLSRATKRSSIIGNKIKNFVSKDKQRPRPKSLDIDTFLDAKSKEKNSIEEHERSKSTYSLERNRCQKVPDSLLHQEFSERSSSSIGRSSSTVGPGSYYNFESSTMPRTQAKKYDFPWESLPKDWTTSVKLREISKRRSKEDRQSSSGNWSQSGTSSNRHSLDSDLRSAEGYKFNSQYSLGKDSGRDSLTLEEENDYGTDGTSTAGYAADGTSTIAGSSDSVSIGNTKSDFTQLDTETWLQSLVVRAAKREEVSADGSTSLSRLTRQNILALDLMMSDEKGRPKTDEESSIYSVDQEGFYTSFHNDSGLKKSTNTLVDEDEDYSPTKDTISVCSVESVIHRPDKSEKFANLRKGNSASQAKVLNKVTPPAPPPRTTSTSSKDHLIGDNSKSFEQPELHSFPSQDSSISESDPEAVFSRVQSKTLLSSTGFPSLVALSTSDDESSPDTSNTKSNSRKKADKYIFNETECELGLSETRNTSDFSYVSYQTGSFLDSTKTDSSVSSSESSLKHSKSALECTDQGYDSFTLPKGSHRGRTVNDKSETSYRSWPRSHKAHPTSGILKTPEKQSESRPPKSLNFAPMLNLFKPGAHNSVQMPLPSPTNSSSSESNLNTSVLNGSSFHTSPDQSYKLSVPIQDRADAKSAVRPKQKLGVAGREEVPLKYQQVITVTPRSRSGDRQGSDSDRSSGYGRLTPESNNKSPVCAISNMQPNAQSTPHAMSGQSNQCLDPSQSHYAVSPVVGPKDSNRRNSNQSGISNNTSGEYMDMRSNGSLKSANSSSSLSSSEGVSLGENSTYMSMSSPCSSPNLSNMDFSISSTPRGSIDSLLDMRKTPTNELETDTYQINTSILVNNHHRNGVKRENGFETIPIVTQGSNGMANTTRTSSDRSTMSSFRMPNESGYSVSNRSDMSLSSHRSTPGRRSLDSSDGDLTNVTQMSMTPSSLSSPAVSRDTSYSKQGRQVGRQARADTRKEPSYRNYNASNRRSLPSDMPATNVHKRHIPLNDTVNSKGRVSPQVQKGVSPQVQKGMPTSRSCPVGFNGIQSNNPGSIAHNSNMHRSNYNPGMPSQSVTINGDNSGSAPRSDSYRIATGGGQHRSGSYRVAMHQSKSYPVLPPSKQSGPYRVAMDMNPKATNAQDDDVMSRADSYRIAVRNTNGIVPDIANRNTSYRFAVTDEVETLINPKLDALSMDKNTSSLGRDARRMGITDVDQAKNISGRPSSGKNSKGMSQSQSSGRIRKVTKQDVDPIEVVATVDNNNDSRKANKNNQNRSSTYIQFDPIFEDTEDFNPFADPRASMDLSSRDYSLNLSNTSRSKLGLINGSSKDSGSGSTKTGRKHKGAKNIEVEDNWRFSQV